MTRGFALTEALIALLLLAISLLGAGATLVESLAASRATLLESRASDLAGDLAESLRPPHTAVSQVAIVADWQHDARDVLPLSPGEPLAYARLVDLAATRGRLPENHSIELGWWDQAARAPHRLQLPVALTTMPEPD